MNKKNKEKSVITNETSVPEAKPTPTLNTKVDESKAMTKNPGMSKLRKLLIIVGSTTIGLSLITLILDGVNENGTIEIITFVLMVLSLIATEALSILTYKREPNKKVFPLICLIICSILLGAAVIVGIFVLFSII